MPATKKNQINPPSLQVSVIVYLLEIILRFCSILIYRVIHLSNPILPQCWKNQSDTCIIQNLPGTVLNLVFKWMEATKSISCMLNCITDLRRYSGFFIIFLLSREIIVLFLKFIHTIEQIYCILICQFSFWQSSL